MDLARHWMLDPDITYLNHGSYGACPRPVLAAQQALRDQLEAQAGTNLSRFLPIHVGSLADFVARHREFYYYEFGGRRPLFADILAAGGTAHATGFNRLGEVFPRPGYVYRIQMSR